MNKIVTPNWTADDRENDNLMSASCFIGNSLVGEELSIDTADATVDSRDRIPTIFAPADADGLEAADGGLLGVLPYVSFRVKDLGAYNYADPVYFYHDDVLIGKFYMSSVKRVGKYLYEISCVSGIGLLENSTHYGGIYEGTPMEVVLADIIGGIIPYNLANEFVGIKVYGWLPIDTRRNNLHQLLFAEGGSIKKDANGEMQIVPLTDDVSSELPDSRLFIGGSLDLLTPATKISVSEHSYSAYENNETTTLFEGDVYSQNIITPNGNAVVGSIIRFDEPIHDLSIENGTIIEHGVNYAVLSPSASCKLFGKKYMHIVRQVTRPDASVFSRSLIEENENEITVTNATLVSLVNSENVADRLMGYYSSAKVIDADIVVDSERPGDSVSFNDPFDQPTKGFIKSMDIRFSSKLRASTEIIEGYIPSNIGNFYKNKTLLFSQGQSFTVKEGTTKIRVVLIGPGRNGYDGEDGEDGESVSFKQGVGGKGGAGGKGGSGGEGGRIYIITLQVEAGDILTFKGGDSGDSTNPYGTHSVVELKKVDGTTVTYSSEEGTSSPYGYIDPIDGKTYARKGIDGRDGNKGSGTDGDGPPFIDGDYIWPPGATGQAAYGKNGSTIVATAEGGFGGGSTALGPGINGSGGRVSYNNGYFFADGGDGGPGADGGHLTNSTSGYGSGGTGGDGGGGGGGGGAADNSNGNQYASGGHGGKGGKGSPGLPGDRGCALIYS